MGNYPIIRLEVITGNLLFVFFKFNFKNTVVRPRPSCITLLLMFFFDQVFEKDDVVHSATALSRT